MRIKINKKEEILEEGITVKQLMEMRKLKKAAVWIGGRQLLSAEYETYQIQDGDEIKLLRIMAGG